ncbi:MAG: ATPase [Pirellulaceae bacterium]|nr:MAG: ATPase [Pirellulaceae bacterium]
MYCEHWKLTKRPFENVLADDAYYPAESHQAAMLKMRYAIENGRGAVLISGVSGVGKTLVTNRLLSQLPDSFQPQPRIVFPALDGPQMVHYLAMKLVGSDSASPGELPHHLQRIEQALHDAVERGQHPVVMIDEAHLLEEHGLLEPLRLLLNLQPQQQQKESAWTMILIGHPNLMAQVERHPALDERIAVKCVVSRMSIEETVGYIQHRMQAAGAAAEDVFAVTAMERIHVLTEGVPRRINRLCDLALMVGFAEDRKLITPDVVDSVHGELVVPMAS